MIDPVVVIPVYNHERVIEETVRQVRLQGMPCILVDDGSRRECAAVLDTLINREQPTVTLVRLVSNQGKGGAVKTGLREANARGYSHALQIDADGQHDANDIPRFINAARRFPHALIAGEPVYDRSIPKGRLYGRWLTHLWVWINTLSLAIRDSMCGFRVYPLKTTLSVIDHTHLGQRMDFDPEIAVRLVWQGVDVVNLQTPVSYPQDGVSHFQMGRDNLRISLMHAKLFFGMLVRLPAIARRRIARRSYRRGAV